MFTSEEVDGMEARVDSQLALINICNMTPGSPSSTLITNACPLILVPLFKGMKLWDPPPWECRENRENQ